MTLHSIASRTIGAVAALSITAAFIATLTIDTEHLPPATDAQIVVTAPHGFNTAAPANHSRLQS